MGGRKEIRSRGKIKLSEYFKKLNTGDIVSVVREKSLDAKFPRRLQGRTGVVKGKKGRAYIIKIKDQEKEKEFLIAPVHLKKLK
jgi:large subunit ribosomal protein L21e